MGFGNTQRVPHGHSQSVIGPGNYENDDAAIRYKSPAFDMGKAKGRNATI
jgi:hypothetical protein